MLKGRNSKLIQTRVMVLVLCTSSSDALYLYEVSRRCLERFSYYSADTILSQKLLFYKVQRGITKRVTVFVLCMASYDASYLYEVSSRYLERFSSYRADTIL